MPATETLTLPALAIRQTATKTLYSFAVDGKHLHCFAAVSRIQRDDDHQVAGYQRPEAIAHIGAIRSYLETADAMLPNALVVAFDERVRFEADADQDPDAIAQSGTLLVPVIAGAAEHEKPGWIVDGQQRSAAIRDAKIDSFPVCVTAFITESVSEQRSQFILVNSTKPLPKGLIHELLPVTPADDLPIALLKRRFPAVLLDRLNYDADSPLRGRIRTPTTTTGVIKDNSILKSLAMSIEDGALYPYFDSDTGHGEVDAMLELLKGFWDAVAAVFPDAWDSSPRRSRLVHGVGILSLGCLMDEIAWELRDDGIPASEDFQRCLERVAPNCRWIAGVWDLAPDDQRRWNELQNTPRDVRALSDHLIRLYRTERVEQRRLQAAA